MNDYEEIAERVFAESFTEDVVDILTAQRDELLAELIETHAGLCFTQDYIGTLRYERNKAAIAKCES